MLWMNGLCLHRYAFQARIRNPNSNKTIWPISARYAMRKTSKRNDNTKMEICRNNFDKFNYCIDAVDCHFSNQNTSYSMVHENRDFPWRPQQKRMGDTIWVHSPLATCEKKKYIGHSLNGYCSDAHCILYKQTAYNGRGTPKKPKQIINYHKCIWKCEIESKGQFVNRRYHQSPFYLYW